MAERRFYACSATTDSVERFFLWYSDEIDGVVLDGQRILAFSSQQALAQYCAQRDFPLSDEPTACYDFDAIDEWIRDLDHGELDVQSLLNAWNMMDDFYRSIGMDGAMFDKNLDLHEKLSLSNFVVSLPGAIVDENYDPKWTSFDRRRLSGILRETIARFKAAL